MAADEIFIALFLSLPIIIINIFTDKKKWEGGNITGVVNRIWEAKFGLGMKIVSSNYGQKRGVSDSEAGTKAVCTCPLGRTFVTLYAPSQKN